MKYKICTIRINVMIVTSYLPEQRGGSHPHPVAKPLPGINGRPSINALWTTLSSQVDPT